MKKIIAMVMAAMLLMLTFAGCAKTAGTEAESTTEDVSVAASSESDYEYIKSKGTLIVGITDYAPMDYKENGSDEWTGFDAEFARAVGEKMGVEVKFIEIDWDNKFLELKSKSIDCVWNGMTITEEVTLNTACTKAYVKNAQVVVMAADKAANYKDAASLKDLTFAVESGSAGESAAKDNNLNYTAVTAQSDALMEVAAGSSDACIIDITMANAMTGTGTSYADLTTACELTSEEYGIGFRKGSDMADKLNSYMDEFKADGTLTALASKYELTLAF